MKKIGAGVAAAICVVALAGCSESGTPSDDADNSGAPLEKSIGQPAYSDCPTSDGSRLDECGFTFKVTNIENVKPDECPQYAIDEARGRSMIRVTLDAEARPTATSSSPGTVVTARQWKGTGADGYVTPAQFILGCDDGGVPSYGPFYTILERRQRGTGTMVFAMPLGSTHLYLGEHGLPGWTWKLPAA